MSQQLCGAPHPTEDLTCDRTPHALPKGGFEGNHTATRVEEYGEAQPYVYQYDEDGEPVIDPQTKLVVVLEVVPDKIVQQEMSYSWM